VVEVAKNLKEGEDASLPIREEEDALDAEELIEWLEGSQTLLGSFVKQNQAVESY